MCLSNVMGPKSQCCRKLAVILRYGVGIYIPTLLSTAYSTGCFIYLNISDIKIQAKILSKTKVRHYKTFVYTKETTIFVQSY